MRILISGNGSGLKEQIKMILEHRDDFEIEIPKYPWEEGKLTMINKQLKSPYEDKKEFRKEMYNRIGKKQKKKKGK